MLYMDFKLDMYNHVDTFQSLKFVFGLSDIFEVFMTASTLDFYNILQFLAKVSQSL